jgi:hypothetical protein
MAIKGGSWRCGSYTINGNTAAATATVSELWFNPIGISFIGRNTIQQTAGTSTVQDEISIGSAISPTSRQSAGLFDENATANSEINTIVRYDSILSFPSATGTVQATYDLDNINPAGFRVVVTTAGGVANEWQGYLAFGSKRIPGISSVGHPFIM